MEITLKVQNIGAGYDPEAKKDIVITHEFSIPSDQLLKKRGRLFITLKIGTNGDFDLKEVASLFLDSVQENFYRLTEETPLHSLEKALNRAIKLVLTIKSRHESISLGSVEANFKLNFATALVWNKVLYTSYLGSPAVYLVRGTGVRNLSMTPATNEIWTNSGILDNQDVVIIGTETFAKAFPANEIINSLGNISYTISNHPKKDELAAMLIKISTNEDQAASLSNKVSGGKLKDAISSTLWRVKAKFSENEKLSDRFKFYQSKKTAPVSSISGLSAPAAASASVNLPKGPKRMANPRSKKGKKRIAVGLTMVAVSLAGIYQFLIKPLGAVSENDITPTISFSEAQSAQVMGASDSTGLAANTELTVDIYEQIFDAGSLDSNPTVVGLSSTSKKLILLDASSRALYSINPETKEYKSIFDKSSMPLLLDCNNTYCFIADSGSSYMLDPEDPKIEIYTHNLENLVDISAFGSSMYLLTNNQVYTQAINKTDNNEPKPWLNSAIALERTKAMAIDGNIYVLTDTEVIKLYNGNRVNGFNLDYSKLQNPINIDILNNTLYILDGTKIHTFSKSTGDYIKTIELTKDVVEPQFFTPSRYSNNKLLFEKNKVLYEVPL